MKQFGKILGLTVGFGILAAVLASIPSRPVTAAGAAPVMVVNTPLPVQGTVSAVQTGTWNVGITGTPNVTVGNPASSPVLVGDVDNAARHAFVASGSLVISGTDLSSPFTVLTTVPRASGLLLSMFRSMWPPAPRSI